jgi:hypothetical protein
MSTPCTYGISKKLVTQTQNMPEFSDIIEVLSMATSVADRLKIHGT